MHIDSRDWIWDWFITQLNDLLVIGNKASD